MKPILTSWEFWIEFRSPRDQWGKTWEGWAILHNDSINPLWPSDTIWWYRSWSTLIQIMACCLRAPSHYLNQCWLTSVRSSDSHLRATSHMIHQPSISNRRHISRQSLKLVWKLSITSLKGQWVNQTGIRCSTTELQNFIKSYYSIRPQYWSFQFCSNLNLTADLQPISL